MAELCFKYGPMKSGKTRDLIKTWYNYNEKDLGVIIIKPESDKKAGNNIQSRAKEELKANYVVPSDTNLYELIFFHTIKYNPIDCVLIDEAQFLTEKQVDELVLVVDDLNIKVFCYGLKKDAFGHVFPGSKRLFENADVLKEIDAVCKCGGKATENLRLNRINGELIPVFSGEQISIDGIDSDYDSVCRKCYKRLRTKYNKGGNNEESCN